MPKHSSWWHADQPKFLERFPEESDQEYENRCGDLDYIIKRLYANTRHESEHWNHLSDNDYQYFGEQVRGIRSNSIPSPNWDRIQCIFWIRRYLWKKVCLSEDQATRAACNFKESGDWLVMMGADDWYELCGEYGGGLSLFGRMERLKRLGLIAPDDGEEKAEESAGQEDGNSNQGTSNPPDYEQFEDGPSVKTEPDDMSVDALINLER